MKSEKKKSGSRMKSKRKKKEEILLIRLWIEKEAESIYKLQSASRD